MQVQLPKKSKRNHIMLYYLLSFYQLVKKQYLLVFGLYLGLYIILFIITTAFTKTLTEFNILLGVPEYTSALQIIWTLFQISCHAYITYTFFSYEQDSSFEYIILRESYLKNFIKKLILILLITIVIRVIIFFGTYLFFYHSISFNISSFIYNIVIYLVVSLITTIAVLFIKRD